MKTKFLTIIFIFAVFFMSCNKVKKDQVVIKNNKTSINIPVDTIYGNGYRAGLLYKFSQKDSETYGELELSSVRSNSGINVAQEYFLFTVKNESIISQLQQLTGEFIIIHYKSKSWGEKETKTIYIVDSVKKQIRNFGE